MSKDFCPPVLVGATRLKQSLQRNLAANQLIKNQHVVAHLNCRRKVSDAVERVPTAATW